MIGRIGTWSVLVASALLIACGGGEEGAKQPTPKGKADGADAVVITKADDGKTFKVVEGQLVVVELPANPTTGYSWTVVSTDRTFGYPEEEYVPDEPQLTGSGGTMMMTWATDGFLSMLGTHSVSLEYRRPWDETADPADSFSFTVEIVEGCPPVMCALYCADGFVKDEDGCDICKCVERPAPGVVVDEDDDGKTVEVKEGDDVQVRLEANPSTGYEWEVVATDRTFGYPSSVEFEPQGPNGVAGNPGTTVMTWKTKSWLSMVGAHRVVLEYRRPWDPDEVLKTFTFTVNVVPACAPVLCTLWCADGFKKDEDGCEICECASPLALELDEKDDGGEFEVEEGTDVVVSLESNPSTGYEWEVVSTDRTFGYPQVEFVADGPDGIAGNPGVTVMTWSTTSWMSMVGSHTVVLEYRRSWETNEPPLKTFEFTVTITD